MKCVDLKAIANDKFIVTIDQPGNRRDPWNCVILGRRGHVCPYSETRLMGCTKSVVRKSLLLARVQSAKIVQDGDDGINFTFAPEDFLAVAKFMRLAKRKRLSPQCRQRAIERLERFRFRSARKRQQKPPKSV